MASLALVKAVDRYDPARGTPFPAYAAPTILGEVKRYFRDNSRAVSVPRRLQELSQELHRAREVLTQDLGRTPELTEIADLLDVTVSEASWAVAAGQMYHLLVPGLVR